MNPSLLSIFLGKLRILSRKFYFNQVKSNKGISVTVFSSKAHFQRGRSVYGRLGEFMGEWMSYLTNTVEPRFNEPLYSEALGITNDMFQPGNSVMYGKEPRYNEPSI